MNCIPRTYIINEFLRYHISRQQKPKEKEWDVFVFQVPEEKCSCYLLLLNNFFHFTI